MVPLVAAGGTILRSTTERSRERLDDKPPNRVDGIDVDVDHLEDVEDSRRLDHDAFRPDLDGSDDEDDDDENDEDDDLDEEDLVELTRFAPGAEIVPGRRAWTLLGTGPRCATWLAWDDTLGLPVALKIPLLDPSGLDRARIGLRREAGVLAQVRHPRFQRLLDADVDAPLPYVVTEYVEGPPLSVILDDDGPLSPADAAQIGAQACLALRSLHGFGIAHLDLKPSNLMLRDGRVVIIDLGYAQRIGEPPLPGGPRGTDGYMPPEQLRCETVTAASDLFALAVLLDVLLTGERPGDDPDDAGVFRARAAGVDPALCDVLDRLGARDVTERVATAGEALALLAPFLDHDDRPWPDFADPTAAATTDPAPRAGAPRTGPAPAAATELPVPWIALWTGETRRSGGEPFPRPAALVVGGATLSDDARRAAERTALEDWDGAPDRAVARDGAPGDGTPQFSRLHDGRQRQAILEGRCSICGTPQQAPFLFLGTPPPDEQTPMFREPPVCETCAALALRHCPGLRSDREAGRLARFLVDTYVAVPDPASADAGRNRLGHLLARPVDGAWRLEPVTAMHAV